MYVHQLPSKRGINRFDSTFKPFNFLTFNVLTFIAVQKFHFLGDTRYMKLKPYLAIAKFLYSVTQKLVDMHANKWIPSRKVVLEQIDIYA